MMVYSIKFQSRSNIHDIATTAQTKEEYIGADSREINMQQGL